MENSEQLSLEEQRQQRRERVANMFEANRIRKLGRTAQGIQHPENVTGVPDRELEIRVPNAPTPREIAEGHLAAFELEPIVYPISDLPKENPYTGSELID